MKVIRIVKSCDDELQINEKVLEQKYYLVEKEYSSGNKRIMFDGKGYRVNCNEYETLTDEEVKDLLFKKLEQEGQRLLDLGGPNE